MAEAARSEKSNDAQSMADAAVQRVEESPPAAAENVQLRAVPAGASAFHDAPDGAKAQVPANATGTASGQQLSYADLTPAQQQSIQAAVTRAKGRIAPMLSRLNAAKTAVDPVVSHAFKISGTSSDDLEAINKAIQNVNTVSAALNGNLGFEGEDSPAENGTVTLAYVYTGFIGLFDGNIHICFPGWDILSPMEQAGTIIHELTHQKCGTDDNAYMHETAKWAAMDTKDAVNNADSYAYLAQNA